MESWLALGCLLDQSSNTLRITSDPKERRAAAAFAAVFGFACLLATVLVPFSRLGWAGLVVFGCAGLGCLLFAFLAWQCRTEIEFDLARSLIVRRHFCLSRVRSTSALPLGQLKTIKAVETARGAGELQLIQADGKIWAKWVFLVEPLAEDIRREIMAWLKDRSPQPDAEECAQRRP